MITIKHYLKALQDYENKHNSFELLTTYLAEKKSILPELYCQGKVHLPSPILIKKLHTQFYHLALADTELNKLFVNATIHSKLFYSKIIKLVIAAKISNINFEKLFEKEIQPIGQGLMDLLTNIKYRIRFIKTQRQKQINLGQWSVIGIISKANKFIYNFINTIVYQITLINSAHHDLTRKLYYILIMSAIFVIWIVNFCFLPNVSSISSVLLNIFMGLTIIVISVLNYPIGDFGTSVDISGKNIVAYRYRVFFNNHSNSKMINVFTLQNATEARQPTNITINSTKT